jgi:hypothetical protein
VGYWNISNNGSEFHVFADFLLVQKNYANNVQNMILMKIKVTINVLLIQIPLPPTVCINPQGNWILQLL